VWLVVPCSGRQLEKRYVSIVVLRAQGSRSLGCVPVAVFFLPKHCTLWEAMLGGCCPGSCVGGGGRGNLRCRRRCLLSEVQNCSVGDASRSWRSRWSVRSSLTNPTLVKDFQCLMQPWNFLGSESLRERVKSIIRNMTQASR
jgi:hypothetical protein